VRLDGFVRHFCLSHGPPDPLNEPNSGFGSWPSHLQTSTLAYAKVGTSFGRKRVFTQLSASPVHPACPEQRRRVAASRVRGPVIRPATHPPSLIVRPSSVAPHYLISKIQPRQPGAITRPAPTPLKTHPSHARIDKHDTTSDRKRDRWPTIPQRGGERLGPHPDETGTLVRQARKTRRHFPDI
jgi:hypothetical protein